MKKLVLSILAVGALSSGAVWADAECQAGSAWGLKPGCGGSDAGYAGNSGWAPPPNNSGWPPPGAVIPGVNAVPYGYAQSAQAFPYGVPQYAQRAPQGRRGQQIWTDPTTGAQYSVRPRPGDRDGDGVPNHLDRFPDDPRYQ